MSERAKSLAVDLSSALPYREAHLWLSRLRGVQVSLSTVWRVTQAAGAAKVEEWLEHQRESRTRTGAAAFLSAMKAKGASGRFALGVDGLMLRIEHKWHEVKVGVVAPVSKDGHWVRGQMTYIASLAEAQEFRLLVLRHALSRGITRQTVLAIISDGASWIETLAVRHYPNAVFIRDWWHTVEYLWSAAHALYGEGSEDAKRQVKRWETLLWEGKVSVVRRHLGWIKRKLTIATAKAAEEYRKTQVYLDNHHKAMDYKTYRDDKWPIGSGPVEATCKMIQVRMKRSGQNWSRAGAQNMLFLRADYCSRLQASLYPQS